MTISLPGPSFSGLSDLFGGKKKKAERQVGQNRRLSGEQIARRFDKSNRTVQSQKPASLNDQERAQSDHLGSLRNALYSKDD